MSPILVGFLLGKLAATNITSTKDTESSLARAVARSPEYLVTNGTSVLLSQSLLLDRFDSGRKLSTSDYIVPTLKLDGDVSVKVFINPDDTFTCEMYTSMMQSLGTTCPYLDPFEITIAYNLKSEMTIARSLLPSYKFHFNPIHPIRIVQTNLSQSLSSPTSYEDSKTIEYGYIDPIAMHLLFSKIITSRFMTIDQARQVLLLAHNDKIAHELPLVGL
ncbi:hypothetical protein BC830DRAFT_667072 [Chytriomyces sp. MP71]|nr:hypothetical protein BC830DRAFT_667072 [Chytriomyces sp. MP71]